MLSLGRCGMSWGTRSEAHRETLRRPLDGGIKRVAVTEQMAAIAKKGPVPAVDDEVSRGDRWSARLFGVAAVVALPLWLWFGRHRWFIPDEWWSLMQDGLTGPGYLDVHNGHWITVVRFDYRLNFQLWGLRSYLPYQIPAVLAHVGAAVLLRQVIRRLGVRGWIATGVALAFLFFGSGRDNITLGFQVSMTASVVCGLALFLLADGPRSVTGRDWLALGIGLVGLMTSSVFLALLVGVAITTLMRRGARMAAFYAIPLGAIYTAWYLAYGREGATRGPVNDDVIRYAGRMFRATFDALGRGAVGAVLVAVAGFGLGAAIHRVWRSGTRVGAAPLLGFAAGWALFAGMAALTRAHDFPQTYKSDRYLHVGAALLLPLVAAGAEQLARRRTLLGAAALVPLAVGLPANLERLTHQDPPRDVRQWVFVAAHSPLVNDLPPDTQLHPFVFGPVNIGWLAREAAAGRIPEPDAADPVVVLDVESSLLLAQEYAAIAPRTCPPLNLPLRLTLRSGDQIGFTGAISLTTTDGTHESHPGTFSSRDGTVIEAQAGPIDVVVRSANGQPSTVCEPRPVE
jgi:hypothetical protein